MFVCMFYLSPRSRIIVSVPGNIRNSQTKQSKAKQNRTKKEGEKERSGEEQMFSLFVTNKMRMFFFCFFFLFYILFNWTKKSVDWLFRFVNFCFFSVSFFSLFLWEKSHSWRLSKAATWVWFLFSYCKNVARRQQVRLFLVVTWFWKFVFDFCLFSDYRVRAKVFSAFELAPTEKCVLLRTFVPV